jgi:hypothetical protein
MEPRFKIIGNEVKEQSVLREPQPSTREDYPEGLVGDKMYSMGVRLYRLAIKAYEQHLSSLRTYIASDELKERFGDNEFGEKDFYVKNETAGFDNENWEVMYVDVAYPYPYPVSQEQESQEDLWEEAEMKLRQRLYEKFTGADKSTMNLMAKDFTDALKQNYTITKNK